MALPAWLAAIVHTPAVNVFTLLPDITHTDGVVVLYEIGSADVANATGLNANGTVLKFRGVVCAPKVIV